MMTRQLQQPILCLLFTWFFCSTAVILTAQDISKVKKSKPVKVSGSIGATAGFYKSYGREARRDPFFYLLNANLNIKLGGINIPFSAIYSQQETNFLQPFNQFGLSPYYKNLKIHIGYRSMQFSDFTLSGHTFLGVGFEYTPELTKGIQLRTGGMYGRLRRAVAPSDSLQLPTSFKRMGYSGKLGIGYGDKSFIDLIFFKAKDDLNSISADEEAFSNILPAENFVLGIKAEHHIRRFTLELDYASSAYSRDIRSQENDALSTASFYNGVGGLFTPRSSSQYRGAIKGGISYDAEVFSFGLQYKKVDTDFRTLGAYFFLNDIEDYTANFQTKIFKKTLQLNASAGWQRNNLNGEKAADAKRFIASVAMAYTSGYRWNFSLNASNYSSFLTVVQDQISDSSNVFQVSRNVNFNTEYLLVERGNQQAIYLNSGLQSGRFRDEYNIANTENQFTTINLGYRYRWKKKGMLLNTSFNYTSNKAPGYKAAYYGPNVSVSKRLGKKGTRIRFNSAYLFGLQGGAYTYNHLTNRLTIVSRLGSKHNLTLSTALFLKQDKVNSLLSYSEVRGNLGYQFRF